MVYDLFIWPFLLSQNIPELCRNMTVISYRKNYYKEGDYLYPKFDASEAYRRALRTWASWIDRNVNPSKQLIFYRGYSSAHFRYIQLFNPFISHIFVQFVSDKLEERVLYIICLLSVGKHSFSTFNLKLL